MDCPRHRTLFGRVWRVKRSELDVVYLYERLSYDPETGLLHWKYNSNMPQSWNTQWALKEAFTYVSGGRYKQGAIDGVNHHAHRIDWAMYYGEWPTGVVDHINGDGTDNRIENLRMATVSDNAKNAKLSSANSSGVTGVVRLKNTDKWKAQIGHNGKCVFLGHFDTMEEAIAARKQAETKYGFHANHGREEGFGK